MRNIYTDIYRLMFIIGQCSSSFIGVGSKVDSQLATIAADPAFVYNSENFKVPDGLTQSLRNMTCEVGKYL